MLGRPRAHVLPHTLLEEVAHTAAAAAQDAHLVRVRAGLGVRGWG